MMFRGEAGIVGWLLDIGLAAAAFFFTWAFVYELLKSCGRYLQRRRLGEFITRDGDELIFHQGETETSVALQDIIQVRLQDERELTRRIWTLRTRTREISVRELARGFREFSDLMLRLEGFPIRPTRLGLRTATGNRVHVWPDTDESVMRK